MLNPKEGEPKKEVTESWSPLDLHHMIELHLDNEEDLKKELVNLLKTKHYDPNFSHSDSDPETPHGGFGTFLHYLFAQEEHAKSEAGLKALEESETKFNFASRDPEGKTLLRLAVHVLCPPKLIQRVLELSKQYGDANAIDIINQGDKRERTPLHIACALGRKDIVELLLKFGANPNSRDKEGKTPLTYASLPDKEMRALLEEIEIHPDRSITTRRNIVLYPQGEIYDIPKEYADRSGLITYSAGAGLGSPSKESVVASKKPAEPLTPGCVNVLWTTENLIKIVSFQCVCRGSLDELIDSQCQNLVVHQKDKKERDKTRALLYGLRDEWRRSYSKDIVMKKILPSTSEAELSDYIRQRDSFWDKICKTILSLHPGQCSCQEAEYAREDMQKNLRYDKWFIQCYRIALKRNETVLQKCVRGQKEVQAYLKTYLEQKGKDNQQQSGTYFFSSSTSSTDSGSTAIPAKISVNDTENIENITKTLRTLKLEKSDSKGEKADMGVAGGSTSSSPSNQPDI